MGNVTDRNTRRGGCALLGLTAIVFAVFALRSPGPDAIAPAAPSLSAAQRQVRLEACEAVISAGERAGVIASTRPTVLVVEEIRWSVLDWETKKRTMTAWACIQARGDHLGEEVVRVEGRRSGRQLASSVPGLGSFSPD